MELSETAAILDAILNFSKRSTLQGVHPADSERVHPRLPKLINKNTLHKISGFFILLPDYSGLSESGLCVFRELCPVSFLVVGESPLVLL